MVGLAVTALALLDPSRWRGSAELAVATDGDSPAVVAGNRASTTTLLPDDSPLVGAAAVGGLPPRTRSTPTTEIDNRVFVLGDSVMQAAAPLLGDALPQWSVIADTKVGRFLDEGVGVLKRRHSQIGEIAVILMGNNYNGDEVAFRSQLDDAMEQLQGVEHVIFFTVTMYDEDRAEVNDALADLGRSESNVTVVDWGAWCDENVDDFLVGDRLHLTPEGAEALAELVGESVTRVTRAAGEYPEPGVARPDLNTKGTIPKSKGTTKRRTTRTTAEDAEAPATTSSPANGEREGTPSTTAGNHGGGTVSSAAPPTTASPPPTTAAPPPATAGSESAG